MTLTVHAQVSFQGKSAIPRDRFVNVFSFRKTTDFVAEDFADLGMLLNQFYCAAPAGHVDPIMAFMSRTILTNPKPVVNFYAANEVGSPIGTADLIGWDTAGGATDLPQEVALCMSFHGDTSTALENGPVDPVTGKKTRPRAQRRGRIYIGPLTTGTLVVGPHTDPGRPLPEFVNTVAAAGQRLLDDPDNLAPGKIWCVHSRKTAAFHDVIGGHVDNDFDTQRRRSAVSTARTTYGA